MATFNYLSSQRTAQRLIEKFGAKGIIRRQEKSGETWNPTLTTVDYHVNMARLNYSQSNIDGTLVKTGDLQFYIQAIGLDISPKTTDHIIFAGEIGTIVDVVTMSPSGTNIYYKVQARGFTKLADETTNNYVPLTRKVIAGNGLTGGGTLSKDITISLSQTSLDAIAAAQNGGPQGDKGDDGLSAYQIAVNNGFVGTQTQWLASLKGAKGDKGDTGPQGATGPAGKDGTNGADGSQGPAGKDGADGKSAYQIAVDNGYQGTEQEWLASLKGESGGSSGGGLTESQLLEMGFGKKYTGSVTSLSELIIPLNEIGNAKKIVIDFHDISLSAIISLVLALSNTDNQTFAAAGYNLSGFAQNTSNAVISTQTANFSRGFITSYVNEIYSLKLDITINSNIVAVRATAATQRTSGSTVSPITYVSNTSLSMTNPKFIKIYSLDGTSTFSCQYTKKEYT